ncbi:ATP-binding cassette domain-containing protein [Clostridium scatologenes]|nr:ATP-binding cassette domain-containing protein [Clostridium scatologenes]
MYGNFMVVSYYFTEVVISLDGFHFNKQKGKYIIMESLITLENVSKIYGNKCVLDNINLKIVRGQNLAIIGDNGTGKSTLLRIIAGLSSLSSGKRILCTNGDKLKIGYVPDRFPKLNFTPYEYIYYMAKLEGFSQTYIDKCSSELFQTFNIDLMKDTRIKYLSKGTIQKVAVIQAFMSKPDILLLDEPLIGNIFNIIVALAIALIYAMILIILFIKCIKKKLF